MHTVLWVLQVMLAALFLVAGGLKLVLSKEKLTAGVHMRWAEEIPDNGVKLIGVFEVLVALGLVLPGITGIATLLTSLAALGGALIMLGAAGMHLRRQEMPMAVVTGVLLVVSAFIASARLHDYPL